MTRTDEAKKRPSPGVVRGGLVRRRPYRIIDSDGPDAERAPRPTILAGRGGRPGSRDAGPREGGGDAFNTQ
jgi:hypothetical protein